MNPSVAVIILNYNGWRDTIECLQSILAVRYDNFGVVLVDNASNDASLSEIRAYFEATPIIDLPDGDQTRVRKRVELTEYTREEVDARRRMKSGRRSSSSVLALALIKNERNYGFAEGVNIGARYALANMDPDYVLLLNNDTVVDQVFLHELIEAAEHDSRAGLVTPKILRYVDGAVDATGILCDFLGRTQHRGWGEPDRGQYDQEIDKGFFYADGACLLIRKNVLSALEGECFDPYLFAYGEDFDLSWMARLLGYKIAYCPTSTCRHKSGATSGGQNPQTAYFVYKNRLRVMIKNYSLVTLVFALPVTILLKLFLLSGGAVVNRNPQYLTSFLRAFWWNTRNFTSAIKRRRFIQSRRMVTDKDVMTHMVRYSLEADSVLRALSLRGRQSGLTR